MPLLKRTSTTPIGAIRRSVLPHLQRSIVVLQTPGEEPMLLTLIRSVIERDIESIFGKENCVEYRMSIEDVKKCIKQLEKEGYEFKSETDTEVACAVLDYLKNK